MHTKSVWGASSTPAVTDYLGICFLYGVIVLQNHPTTVKVLLLPYDRDNEVPISHLVSYGRRVTEH